MMGGSVLVLRRERRDERVIGMRVADLCGTTRGAEHVEEFNVGLVVFGPLVRCVVLVVDGLYGADRFTGTTVNALVGVDVERALPFVDTVNRALLNTCLVLDIHARLRNYVRHEPQPSFKSLIPAQF